MFWIIYIVCLLMDLYVYQPVKTLLRGRSPVVGRWVKVLYWSLPVALFLISNIYTRVEDWHTARYMRYAIIGLVSVNYIPKIFIVVFLLLHDALKVFQWTVKTIAQPKEPISTKNMITRGEFISKVALISSTAPLGLMAYGVLKGAYDYRVVRKTIYSKDLPKAFDGITLAQISDIHTGSLTSMTSVKGGIEMLLNEKPDIITFTGDIVNNKSNELEGFTNVFDKLRAPLGVYSVTGNHDYGDYSRWKDPADKQKNFEDLIAAQKQMGYDLLMNENRTIEVDGEKISIIGIENWGAGRFQKYGKLDEAYKGSEESPFKVLLSHDPSHWDAQVKDMYPDINLMLAGHTHGFQFGVEVGDFKWSPSQYIYKQWAGHYQDGEQQLYVNRGFGFIGFPGRVGIPPELTVLTLKKA